tara:strand:+ start:210 stop:470 length:261 start_codon:yes stop_codon:yes gene_type:complete
MGKSAGFLIPLIIKWFFDYFLHYSFDPMNLGLLFLESVSTGVITQDEMNWIAAQQANFSRLEAATALKLGRLLDTGLIQLGCRIRN